MESEMSYVNHYHSGTSVSSDRPKRGLAAAVELLRAVSMRLRNRREMNYLLSMSDYELRDIGLQRGDVQREAVRPLWRP
jgi:uncharacterized protein YjiS (DUF1127 family)